MYIVEVPIERVYDLETFMPSQDIAEFLDTCVSFEQWYPTVLLSNFSSHKFVFSDKIEATKFKIFFG